MSTSTHKRTNILVMLVFILVILFIIIKDEKGISLKAEERGLTLSAISDETYYVDYDKIRNISLITEFDRGERITGSVNKGISSGTWRNQLYEEYTLIVYDKIPSAIILETEEGVIAFNYESETTTEQLYKTLKDYLTSR